MKGMQQVKTILSRSVDVKEKRRVSNQRRMANKRKKLGFFLNKRTFSDIYYYKRKN